MLKVFLCDNSLPGRLKAVLCWSGGASARTNLVRRRQDVLRIAPHACFYRYCVSVRRGAEPLDYAVDGGPGLPAWNPNAQTKIIARLIRVGADPNAVGKGGVAPLHRAVRNRCAAAVGALIDGGADPRVPNRNSSTPVLLATQNTGRGGSGSAESKAQQQEILRLLTEHGAT